VVVVAGVARSEDAPESVVAGLFGESAQGSLRAGAEVGGIAVQVAAVARVRTSFHMARNASTWRSPR
jgi:hypothetical protein